MCKQAREGILESPRKDLRQPVARSATKSMSCEIMSVARDFSLPVSARWQATRFVVRPDVSDLAGRCPGRGRATLEDYASSLRELSHGLANVRVRSRGF